MKNRNKQFMGRMVELAVVAAAVLAIAGCAGMMAADNFKKDATQKYVFNLPTDRLFDEVVSFMKGGAVGSTLMTATVSEMQIDKANLTATGPWKRGSMIQNRMVSKVTRVDDAHSAVVMMEETQTMDTTTKGWKDASSTRKWTSELSLINKLDAKAYAEIEAGAKKAAEDAKKK